MHITSRDKWILSWINQQGFARADQVAKKFGIERKTAYGRLHKLMGRGLLRHSRILFNEPGVYRVTRLAQQFCDQELPALSQIPLGSYRHDGLVVDVLLALEQQLPVRVVTERCLRHKLGLRGVGQQGHISDGQLIFPDKTVAIEVELSVKGQSRLDKIFKHHLANFDVGKVWYFCRSQNVMNALEPYAQKTGVAELFLLSELQPLSERVQAAASWRPEPQVMSG